MREHNLNMGIRVISEPTTRQLDLWRVKQDAEYTEDQFREAAHHFDMTLAALNKLGMPIPSYFVQTMETLSDWHRCAEEDLQKACDAYEDKIQTDRKIEL